MYESGLMKGARVSLEAVREALEHTFECRLLRGL